MMNSAPYWKVTMKQLAKRAKQSSRRTELSDFQFGLLFKTGSCVRTVRSRTEREASGSQAGAVRVKNRGRDRLFVMR